MQSFLTQILGALLILILTGISTAFADDSDAPPESLASLAAPLAGASFNEIDAIVLKLEAEAGEAALPLLNALVDGELYYRRDDQRLLRVDAAPERQYQLYDFFDNSDLGIAGRRDVSKVKTHNRLRSSIRQVIARLTLSSRDPARRMAAVTAMFGELDSDGHQALVVARQQEADRRIQEKMDIALSLYALKHGDITQRMSAAKALSGRLESEVRNALKAAIASTDAESEPALLAALQKASRHSTARVERYELLNTLFFGLSLGSVFLLAAAGLAITFGVMGVINMAHGELIMLGAYSTYVVQQLMPNHIGLSILISIPVAFIVAGSVGILIERGVIQFLKGRPLETLLATFGISLILQQAVRSIFSPLNRQVFTPEWLSGSLQINPVLSLTYNRLYILLFALMVFAMLLLIMKKTSLGLRVRAVSQNRDMAKAIGIRTEWVDAMTFGLGSGIAGVGGVALSLITNVGPNLGQAYIIDSFMVVVFGGAGNLWGTLVGSFGLGLTNKFLEPVTGAVLANILVLIFIILFIQKRPRGLFPQKGRAAE
ncbi:MULTISPECIES: urea ABC transporter permease subunit UrtB [unclassified Spongiibacter]|uniref:urea ABC transporter permease subunit UrtB n=2 Tax=Spongiibacter TaxID=630749 RepID=UPI00257ED27B|nr:MULTISPECIES: urea ABC transporter permease subunit UrtB [unclassified Spongiibacter]